MRLDVGERVIDRLQELEGRVTQLEQVIKQFVEHSTSKQGGTLLVAPVAIVDTDGRTLLEVRRTQHETSVLLFNAQGRAVASLGVDGTECGYLTIQDADGVLVAYLDVESAGARLILQDHARKGGITLFGGDSGDDDGGGINLSNSDGEVSASIWAGKDKPELVFYGAEGNVINTLP